MPMPTLGSLGWDGPDIDMDRHASHARRRAREMPRMFSGNGNQFVLGAGPMIGGPGDPIGKPAALRQVSAS